ncbi:MAG: hypothetical protein WB765_06730, partial [Acidimicrobiales bacterium]
MSVDILVRVTMRAADGYRRFWEWKSIGANTPIPGAAGPKRPPSPGGQLAPSIAERKTRVYRVPAAAEPFFDSRG